MSVLIQQGDGVFLPATDYPVGSQPGAVKSGDFNNDGRPDLITANFDGTLTLLRGRTTEPGLFTKSWPALTMGNAHKDVAVGFFNAGTHLDVVTPNYYDASLSVALGIGDGTFHTPRPPEVPVNGGPSCVVVDDFNGDGTFTTAANYWVGGSWVVAGDLNNDDMTDLIMDLGSKVGLFWNDTLPRLEISTVTGISGTVEVRVAYPAWKPYTLQVSSNSADPDSWQDVSNAPVTVVNQHVITDTITGESLMYRLKRP